MLNKIYRVYVFQLKQAFSSPRVPLLFAIIAVFVFSNVQYVGEFSREMGIAATPWALPHITNNYICQLVIMSIVILLFCDAPFNNGAHNYILPRAGNLAWVSGICLYIVILSFLFVLVVLTVSVIALAPNVSFSLSWGKIWGTLARTNAGAQYGLPFSVSDYIIGAYTPLRAVATAFLLEWACCIWLGMVIYVFNSASDTLVGCLIAAAFVFLDITIWNDWSYSFYRISPVTMTQLAAISRSESLYGLSKEYVIMFFAISIVALIILSIILPFAKRRIMFRTKGVNSPVDNILSVNNVTKTYGQQTALKNVSLNCEAGKIYGLVGRNGSGKTVLLKCICGLTLPTDGSIYVWGKQVGSETDFPDNIGFIIEHPGFLLNESGIANLKHLASIRKKIDAARIYDCMKLVGLDPDSKKTVGKYSLGMRQRLGIAQAIMEEPGLLILDEPMNGLDNQGVEHIRSILKELSSNGTTILLASHSNEDISVLCSTVFEMDAGTLSKRVN